MNYKYETIEKKLGVKLPQAYKTFASTYAGHRVKEGMWLTPTGLEVLDEYDEIEIGFIDCSARQLRQLVPVLVDDIEGDLVMLDYRENQDYPKVFTVKARTAQRNKVCETYNNFSEFLDVTCKNYFLKSQYLDVLAEDV